MAPDQFPSSRDRRSKETRARSKPCAFTFPGHFSAVPTSSRLCPIYIQPELMDSNGFPVFYSLSRVKSPDPFHCPPIRFSTGSPGTPPPLSLPVPFLTTSFFPSPSEVPYPMHYVNILGTACISHFGFSDAGCSNRWQRFSWGIRWRSHCTSLVLVSIFFTGKQPLY